MGVLSFLIKEIKANTIATLNLERLKHNKEVLEIISILENLNVDNYYFTNFGRSELIKFFKENKIANLTKNLSEVIDDIAISKAFVRDSQIEA